MPLKNEGENRKYHKEYMKKWRKDNPDKYYGKPYSERREYHREYFRRNKEKLSARKKKYYQDNKEYFKQKSLEHYEKNKEKKRIKWQQLRKQVISHYGEICACCGESRIEFLAIDHINNNGADHRKSITTSIYRWLEKNNYPDGFQILCHNCNLSKAFYGYCPHQMER